MKKIIFSLTFLFFVSAADAGKLIQIFSVENSVSIKTPTGGELIYKSSDNIPNVAYGSTITALCGPVNIKIFSDSAEIFLEKDQSVFITKNPITKAIELLKRESKNQKPVKIILAGRANAYVGYDTKISLTEQYPSVFFEVKTGRAIVRGLEGRMFEIEAGDRYEARKSLLD